MQTLFRGQEQADVLFLQRMLNKRRATPRLAEDAKFGPLTEAAVIAFQRTNHVPQRDGIVTPATWAKFGAIIERDHRERVRMFAQPNNMSCWSAAATMVTGNIMSFGPAGAQTTPAGRFANGSVRDAGGLALALPEVETFLRGQGWRLVNSSSVPSTQALIEALTRGPAWAVVVGHTAHAIVLTSIWSDGTADGTVVRIADPWPPGYGAFYGSTYDHHSIALQSGGRRNRMGIQYLAQP
jgi:peptidoglycan hydrolase-like protein with peptidoglycan-binding domain